MSSCQVVKYISILDVIFVVKGKTRSKNLPPFFFDVLYLLVLG